MKNGNESVEMAKNGDCTQDNPEIKEEESLKLECNLTIRWVMQNKHHSQMS